MIAEYRGQELARRLHSDGVPLDRAARAAAIAFATSPTIIERLARQAIEGCARARLDLLEHDERLQTARARRVRQQETEHTARGQHAISN